MRYGRLRPFPGTELRGATPLNSGFDWVISKVTVGMFLKRMQGKWEPRVQYSLESRRADAAGLETAQRLFEQARRSHLLWIQVIPSSSILDKI